MTWLALLACAEPADTAKVEDTTSGFDPISLAVDPPALEFASVTYGTPGTASMTITNTGTSPVHLTATGSDASAVEVQAEVGVPIPPGGTEDVQVTWDPLTTEALSGNVNLFVQDDHAQTGSYQVPVTGTVSVASLDLSTTSISLGTVSVGCEAVESFTVRNAGTATLEVSSLALVDAPDEYALTEAGAALSLPWVLEPGESRAVDLHYTPEDNATVAGLIQIASNDPLVPTAQINVTATGHIDEQNEITYIVKEKNVTAVFALNAVAVFSRSWEDSIPAFFETLTASRSDWRVVLLTQMTGEVVGDTPYIDNTMDPDEMIDVVGEMVEEAGGDNDYLLDTLDKGIELNYDWLIGESDAWAQSTLNLIAMNSDVEQSVGSYVTYVSDYQAYKDDPADVMVHAISGAEPRGCNENGLFAEPSGALEDAANLSGGTFLSWCDDWEESMATLAEAALSGIQRFELTGTPAEWSITVKVDEVTQTEGWTYDAEKLRIDFDDDHWPDEGSEVKISYLMEADCGDE